jgi:nucleoside-diphosphate-sugar epimerase
MSQTPDRNTALIIGFPRLVARGLVVRGLNLHPANQIMFLAEPPDTERAQAFVASLTEDQQTRVELLSGDLAALDLGLDGATVSRLLDTVTLIFHADRVETPTKSQRIKHLVRRFSAVATFARDARRLQRLVVLSTAFVSGDRAGIIREEDLASSQTFRSTFEEAMYEIEHIARALMPRLPTTVLRPSAMIGHSKTGDATGLTEGPNYLVRLMIRLPTEVPFFVPGGAAVPFNIVPIDYVVHATWALAQRPEAASRTFHITDPNPISARKAFELLGEAINRASPVATGSVPAIWLRRALRVTGLARLLPQQMALLDDLSRSVTYACSGTLELLADTDIVCPPFEAYADTLVDWLADYERSQRDAAATAPAGD